MEMRTPASRPPAKEAATASRRSKMARCWASSMGVCGHYKWNAAGVLERTDIRRERRPAGHLFGTNTGSRPRPSAIHVEGQRSRMGRQSSVTGVDQEFPRLREWGWPSGQF